MMGEKNNHNLAICLCLKFKKHLACYVQDAREDRKMHQIWILPSGKTASSKTPRILKLEGTSHLNQLVYLIFNQKSFLKHPQHKVLQILPENFWLDSWTQRIVIHGSMQAWKDVSTNDLETSACLHFVYCYQLMSWIKALMACFSNLQMTQS